MLAPELDQPAELQVGLDTFGDRRVTERVRHGEDRGDQAVVGAVLAEVHDELAVDLDLVDGQAPQVGERRVAGAEVVDRDAHTEAPQRGERVGDGAQVLDEQRLGDLDAQRAGRQVVLHHGPGDVIAQSLVAQLSGTHVDGHRQLIAVRILRPQCRRAGPTASSITHPPSSTM